MLARACWRLGNIDDAHARVSEALATAAQTGDHFYDAELHRIEGDLLLGSALAEARARGDVVPHRDSHCRAPAGTLLEAAGDDESCRLVQGAGAGRTGAARP